MNHNSRNAEKIIDDALQLLRSCNISDKSGWVDAYISHSTSRLISELDYLMSNIPTNKNILEYGSAPFWFTLALAHAGYDVTGTDIAPERFNNFESLNLNIVKVNYDTQPLPIDNDSFDAIICNEVFEHMRNDLIFTFSEAHRVLRRNGELHLSTPNLLSCQGWYNLIFRRIGYSCAGDLHHEWNKINLFGHMGHVREYTAREVTQFLKKIGFRTTRVIFYSENPTGKRQKVFYQLGRLIPSLRSNMRIVATK